MMNHSGILSVDSKMTSSPTTINSKKYLLTNSYSFLAYPDTKYSGLISSISADEAPMMNWIYVDRDTYEVKFGTRPYAEHQLNGPFDCTRQDRRLNFGGWEGFVVVQEGDFWALYFDRDGNGLKSKRDAGIPVLEVELLRKETRSKPKAIKVEPLTGEPILKKEEETPMTPPESVRGDADETRTDTETIENRGDLKPKDTVDKRVKMEDCEEDGEPDLD